MQTVCSSLNRQFGRKTRSLCWRENKKLQELGRHFSSVFLPINTAHWKQRDPVYLGGSRSSWFCQIILWADLCSQTRIKRPQKTIYLRQVIAKCRTKVIQKAPSGAFDITINLYLAPICPCKMLTFLFPQPNPMVWPLIGIVSETRTISMMVTS